MLRGKNVSGDWKDEGMSKELFYIYNTSNRKKCRMQLNVGPLRWPELKVMGM